MLKDRSKIIVLELTRADVLTFVTDTSEVRIM